jgi:hypothetical protein
VRKAAIMPRQLLTFVEEGHQTMDKFLKRHPVEYPIGPESTALEDYGISGIPHVFVVNQAGKIREPNTAPTPRRCNFSALSG